MSAQAGVLEHNVSFEAVSRYKLAALADAGVFAGLVRDAWRRRCGCTPGHPRRSSMPLPPTSA